jgi:apolipoprotein N-acyltransferase
MRAIETGRPMLRATNTGATAIIDARGTGLASLPVLVQSVLEGRVQGHAGATPYVRAGNLPFLVLDALLLVVAAAIGRRGDAAAPGH